MYIFQEKHCVHNVLCTHAFLTRAHIFPKVMIVAYMPSWEMFANSKFYINVCYVNYSSRRTLQYILDIRLVFISEVVLRSCKGGGGKERRVCRLCVCLLGFESILKPVWFVTPHCFLSRRSVVVPVKKPPPGSLAVTTVGAAATGPGLPAGSTPNIFAAAGATPKSMINTTGIVLIYFRDTPSFAFCFLYLHFSSYLVLKINDHSGCSRAC